MEIEDRPEFPRFDAISSQLKEAEDKLLIALKSCDTDQIVHAKLLLMAALDEYRDAVGSIPEDAERK
jgi:hypothetical protein